MPLLIEDTLAEILVKLSEEEDGAKEFDKNLLKFMIAGRQNFHIALKLFSAVRKVTLNESSITVHTHGQFGQHKITVTRDCAMLKPIIDILCNRAQVLVLHNDLTFASDIDPWINSDVQEIQFYGKFTLNFLKPIVQMQDLKIVKLAGTDINPFEFRAILGMRVKKVYLYTTLGYLLKCLEERLFVCNIEELVIHGPSLYNVAGFKKIFLDSRYRYVSSIIIAQKVITFFKVIVKNFVNIRLLNVAFTSFNHGYGWLEVLQEVQLITPEKLTFIPAHVHGIVKFSTTLLSGFEEIVQLVENDLTFSFSRLSTTVTKVVQIHQTLFFLFVFKFESGTAS